MPFDTAADAVHVICDLYHTYANINVFGLIITYLSTDWTIFTRTKASKHVVLNEIAKEKIHSFTQSFYTLLL